MNHQAIIENITKDLRIKRTSVKSTVELLETGATIPFIARYRKEKTEGLDETVIRSIFERYDYFFELEKRKVAILKSIEGLGKLTPALKKKIDECADKIKLEDIYLPFKPKKKTRAQLAREKGLEGLADFLWEQKSTSESREEILARFINPALGVEGADDAIAGARDIIAERIADDDATRGWIREAIKTRGIIISKAKKDWRDKPSKYKDYYDFSEPLSKIPSHRYLAIRRGAKEGVLTWKIETDAQAMLDFLSRMIVKNKGFVFASDLADAIQDSYKRLIFPSLENEAFGLKGEAHETEAISVFSKNLRNLLLSAPAGERPIMGVDPGYRTGCKLACIDRTGRFLGYDTIFPLEGRDTRTRAIQQVAGLIREHKIEIVAIGNGTASKETEEFIAEAAREAALDVTTVMVSESGASVYSASDVAKKEFPGLDVTIRGAVSIARRLQDPLAELVKIDPKSIGVGQYQHDVNQKELRKSLDLTVQSCVNFVGVEVNTASLELLSYVSGIGKSLAENIVKYREKHGRFHSRKELLEVDKMGEKAFELSAGFLRIHDGDDPLDGSGIHPETYPIVERMAASRASSTKELLRNAELISALDPKDFVTEEFGMPTLKDIIRELKKPGLDPRKEFSAFRFSSLINKLSDLSEGMVLPGIVTNVTNFGAFVDIGVHQDGLVHISKLSRNFVRDPYDIVSVGDMVRVKVVSVDEGLKRIALERMEE